MLEDRLPLLGVPITVKEAFALQGMIFFLQTLLSKMVNICRITLFVFSLTGMPNSTGLLIRRDLVSGVDSPSVALLRGQGRFHWV